MDAPTVAVNHREMAVNGGGKKAESDNPVPVKSTPLSEGFQLFCGLPIELRLRIWEMALPENGSFGVQVYQTYDWESASYRDAKLILQLCPRVPGDTGHWIPDNDTFPRNTAMLRACSESNEVYIKRFPYRLPCAFDDVQLDDCYYTPATEFPEEAPKTLHFCDEDVFCFQNLLSVLKGEGLLSGLQELMKLDPSWSFAIRNLRIHIACLDREVFDGFSSLLDSFPSLEYVEAVLGNNSRYSYNGDPEKVVAQAREKLVEAKGSDAKVPKMFYLDIAEDRRALSYFDVVSSQGS